jgi:signal transduction histidine kinase
MFYFKCFVIFLDEKGEIIMKNLSIRVKLFFLIFIVLIPLIVLYVVRIESFYNYNVEHELESNKRLVEAISTSFMNSIEGIWTQETTLNTFFTKKPELPQNEIQYYLKEALINQNIADAFSWVSSKGIVIGSTREDLIGKSVIKREYFQRILKGEDNVVSNLVIGYSTNKLVIPIAKAVKKDGKLVGFMVATIDIDKLGMRLPNSDLTKISRFGIVDKGGYIVYQSDVLNIPQKNRLMAKESPIWLALKGDVVKVPRRKSGYDSTTRMSVYIPIKEIGWACFVTTSYEGVMGKYERQLINDIIVMAVVAFISLLSAFYLSNLILRRLNSLKEAANMMVDGNYSARTNIMGYDEIAVTAQAFDRMADGIESYDKLKTQFFTNLSHELKTPINVIFASVQLISQEKAGIKADERHNRLDKHTKIVKQNCYRLIRLVNNLIDITRFDSGFLSIKPNIYNIVQIIEDISMSIVKYAEIKNIEVLFDTDIEEKYIVCDPDINERIMLNLFWNSLKFTNENGSIRVNIYNNDESVIITVKDNGIGIPHDKLNLIFERFGQVDSSLNRNNEGSGIGLSLVKALVESHKGTISVESVMGKGTEFIIQLPVGVLVGQDYSNYKTNSKSQGMIDLISIEFSDIYSLNDIE